jgi:hypothetical protein
MTEDSGQKTENNEIGSGKLEFFDFGFGNLNFIVTGI